MELGGAPTTRKGTQAAIQAEQQAVQAAVESGAGTVLTRLSAVMDGLVVEMDDARAAALASLPGVRKVYPVHRLHAYLDHALPLHKVPDEWALIGFRQLRLAR